MSILKNDPTHTFCSTILHVLSSALDPHDGESDLWGSSVKAPCVRSEGPIGKTNFLLHMFQGPHALLPTNLECLVRFQQYERLT